MDLSLQDLGFQDKSSRNSHGAFLCDHFDAELVHKIAQLLLPGLASACVDTTMGDLFRTPSSVAIETRKEMVDFLTQKSEAHIAESMIEEGSTDSGNPIDSISDFMDDFVDSKKNLLSRVSAWVLSDRREDKIDDFMQELETNGFWLISRRESVAEILLRNIDLKGNYYCGFKFENRDEFIEHRGNCRFRLLNCGNEGCDSTFCAVYAEKHDMGCPFKVLPCDQKCSESILRREMDKHCITVCPMRLVNCPFYQVGCRSSFPQSKIEDHCRECLESHLVFVLQLIHKRDASSIDDLKERASLLEKSPSLTQRSAKMDVRSLTLAVKELEAKMDII
ncbi:uncharacterized protein LOC18443631 [Amborella trichopoda]|uniref:uncharacterized protein LOC18443631 n=1 Tax=Amborella trichopoda TaxID=13333 RepID=UPI0005D387A9|nr:uncharacterized protein LOC18443631 [Amborella trichopoda]|eukprot:XP_006853878.2 uncharacterized protein LOC18443631 [Amborella trichopoda]